MSLCLAPTPAVMIDRRTHRLISELTESSAYFPAKCAVTLQNSWFILTKWGAVLMADDVDC